MYTLVILSTLAVTVLTTPQFPAAIPIPDGRIVGGEATNIENFKYQASLLYYGSHRCGAAIISPLYVLSAAHCTWG